MTLEIQSGRVAASAGYDATANPFAAGREEHGRWLLGWTECQEERRRMRDRQESASVCGTLHMECCHSCQRCRGKERAPCSDFETSPMGMIEIEGDDIRCRFWEDAS